MSYQFNPAEFGFKPVVNFPELRELLHKRAWVKIIAVGGETTRDLVYWYTTCYAMGHKHWRDDRWVFHQSSFSIGRDGERKDDLNDGGHRVYSGLISTKEFAVELLKNLFGTIMNDGVEKYGKERLEAKSLRRPKGIDKLLEIKE